VEEEDEVDDGEARSASVTGLNKNDGLAGMSKPVPLSLVNEVCGDGVPLLLDKGE